MKLGTKITSGFMALVAFVLVTGVVGYVGIGNVADSLYEVGDVEMPVVEMAGEMKLTLMTSRGLLEEYKGATAALATDNKSALGELERRYQKTIKDFDIGIEAITKGKVIDGTEIIATDNPKLKELINKADKLHNEKFQTAAKKMMEEGKNLIAKRDVATEAMKNMEKAFDECSNGADELEAMVRTVVNNTKKSAKTQKELTMLIERQVPWINAAMELKAQLLAGRVRLEELAQANTLKDIQEANVGFKETVKAFDNVLKALREGGVIDGEKVSKMESKELLDKISEFDATHAAFQKMAAEMFDARTAMVNQAAAAAVAMEKLDAAGDEAADLITKAEEAAGGEMLRAKRSGAESVKVSSISMIVAVLISIIIGIAIGVVITRSITGPLLKMVAGLGLMADGDLTVSVDVKSKDEIGEMAKALNGTVSRLALVVGEIRDAANQTAASGEELSASAQNISSGAQNQASSVEEIGASIEELTASIKEAADNARKSNDVTVSTTKIAEKGSGTVKKSIEGMSLINESSSQIGNIIEVISEIANQTNLLALNAAIEAASAGEHGLGFAVVADEVRKLAERSSQAAKEIKQLIEESASRVNDGSKLSQEVGSSLEEILDGIEKTAAGMAQITAGAEEQATAANEVSKGIETISAVTEENSSSAEEMAAGAEELSAQAQRMQELVAQFKIDEKSSSTKAAASSGKSSGDKAAKPQPAKHAGAWEDEEYDEGSLYHE